MGLKHLGIVLLLAVTLSGCRDKVVDIEKLPSDTTIASDLVTNQWILSNMKYWYFWNDKLPLNPDLSLKPDAFFTSLLYKYDAASRPDGDRFSWIQESADELKASLSGESKTTGMHYKLYYYPKNTTNVIGLVLYTLPDSPAAKAGIKRGDIFTGINNQPLTGANYSALLGTSGTLTYTLGSMNDEGVVTETTSKKDIAPVVFQENPVHFDTVFQYGANKVGYIVYHQFFPSPNGTSSNEYDLKLASIIAGFKSKNVNSLILDLRYNGGGLVSSSTNLASLIGKVTVNDVFYYKEYNKTVTPVLEKQYGSAFFYEKFQAKTQNIGSDLTNLIILVSGNTASASELLINGLKPFMNVTLIGSKTYGKNVGSITISDATKKIKWGLQPIVTKSFNSLKQSDYSAGFTPDIPATETMKLYAYGNSKDPLLGEALYKIIGTRVARKMSEMNSRITDNSLEIGSSLSSKAGGSNMYFDK